MLLGLVIYTVGRLSCLIAAKISWLLISRIVQGFGASTGSVLVQAIAREIYQDKERKQFYSLAGFVLAFSIAVGPFLGGYINDWFHWRANFTLLVFIGVSLFFAAFYCLSETLQQKKTKLLDTALTMLTDKTL